MSEFYKKKESALFDYATSVGANGEYPSLGHTQFSDSLKAYTDLIQNYPSTRYGSLREIQQRQYNSRN